MLINDNSHKGKEKFENEIPNITEKLKDKTLCKLYDEGIFIFPEILKDSEDLTQDQMVLQSINNEIYTSNVMGFLGCSEERLTIKSRFSQDKEDYFFQYMLSKVFNFPNIFEMQTNSDQEFELFQFLLFLFPYYLKKAIRKGLYRTYICKKYNNCNIKGAIDIARHIKLNTPFAGKVAYNQREYSYDNDLTELIRHTIEFIKQKKFGKNILNNVKDEVRLVIEATPKYQFLDRSKIINKNKKNMIRHAYFYEYRALQRLCILILQNQKHRIGCGSCQIFGILFDGAWLWEEYINTLIGERFYHLKNKKGKGCQQLFSYSKGEDDRNIKAGRIYPDFISKSVKNRIIADAKYKPINHIVNKDYLQVLAYMFRFDAKTGLYIYPEGNTIISTPYYLNTGTTYEDNVKAREDIFVEKLGLKIPKNCQNYNDFVEQIKYSEEKLISIFKKNEQPNTHSTNIES